MLGRFPFPPPSQPVVPIAGSAEVFPVHRIYCVGRNYLEHAREMGFGDREAPFFFTKPADAVLPVLPSQIGEFPYPGLTSNLHHEIELVVAIGIGGADIAVADASAHIFGYAVGLDMTRRDLQFALRDQGRPWDVAKGFDHAAPIGPIHPRSETGYIESGRIHLNVNGAKRQDSDVAKLIWNVAETIAHLSSYFALLPGDLIFTGTPEGVGPVVRGDLMEGGIDGLGTLAVRVL